MKNILFIGKFNDVYEDINRYLSKYFSVQICVDNLEMIRGVLRLKQPDLVLVSMSEWERESSRVFRELQNVYVPVLCLGNTNEQIMFAEVTRGEQFTMLNTPVEKEDILKKICEMLHVNMDWDKLPEGGWNRPRKCVMLVDDNAIQLRVLNEILKTKYDVQLATSGMKALTLIGKRVPDLIILDYDMPVCDGKMTFQMIRELEEAKNIPIVFLTGMRDAEHIQAVLSLRPAGYLLKPVNTDALYDILDKYLKH